MILLMLSYVQVGRIPTYIQVNVQEVVQLAYISIMSRIQCKQVSMLNLRLQEK